MVINIGGNEIHALNCVRNLGAYFDKHMTMEQHVESKCRAAYAQLYNIGQVRKYLDHQSAEKLIHALVHNLIDYCNGSAYPNVLYRNCKWFKTPQPECCVESASMTISLQHCSQFTDWQWNFALNTRCLLTFNSLHDHGPE